MLNRKKRLFITLSAPILEELEKCAALDNRSVSNFVETVLLRYFNENREKLYENEPSNQLTDQF